MVTLYPATKNTAGQYFRKQGCRLYSIWHATAQVDMAGVGTSGKKGVTQKEDGISLGLEG